MKIGEFEISLKTIALIIVALIIIFGIISFFSGSNSVNVYGLEFNIPAGFDDVEKEEVSGGIGESYTFTNKEFGEFISISVEDTDASDISQFDYKYPSIKEHTVINGKEGLFVMPSSMGYFFFYIDNGKLVSISVPLVDPSSGLNGEELLAEIIK